MIDSLYLYHTTLPLFVSKGKGRRIIESTRSPKKRLIKAVAKGMHSAKNIPVSQKNLTGQEEIPGIMDKLTDISSCLHFVRKAKKEKYAAIASCDESLS